MNIDYRKMLSIKYVDICHFTHTMMDDRTECEYKYKDGGGTCSK